MRESEKNVAAVPFFLAIRETGSRMARWSFFAQPMNPTETGNPDYFHKVVDCQWACPAHTNVPEYIRLIAQGRYTDAYMLNRESNVFPGHSRANLRSSLRTRLPPRPPARGWPGVEARRDLPPQARRGRSSRRHLRTSCRASPQKKNGKRVACIGAGPASLTVANDLMPHGYEVTIFEKFDKPGGLMRTNIPSFRLPEQVLTDEIDSILNMGVDIRYNSPVESMKALLDEGFDAVFIGSGAPRGKDLEIPGRHETDRIHIGIDWLGSVAFGHIDSIGERVLIIGVGNTAMDCCRSSRRLGGKDIKVMARRPRGFFKASPWELEDAEEEGVEIVINHAPKRFVIEDGKLTGMEFDRLEWDAGSQELEGHRNRRHSLRRRDSRHRPGQRLPLDRARSRHRIRQVGHARRRQGDVPVHAAPASSSAATPHGARRTSSGPWSTATRRPSRFTTTARAIPVTERPAYGMNLISQKMGISEWSYHNDYNPGTAAEDEARRSGAPLRRAEHRSGARASAPSRPRAKSSAASTATWKPPSPPPSASSAMPASTSARSRASPSRATAPEEDLRSTLSAPAINLTQALYASAAAAANRQRSC